MAVEDFIPIEDAKQTVEKEVKRIPSVAERTTIERPGKPVPATSLLEDEKIVKKKRALKKTKSLPSKIQPPEKNSILIITEKPQAAQKIAAALGNESKYSEDGVAYYELERGGKKIIVASAVGHLLGLDYVKGQKGWPIFEIEWVPSYEKKSGAFTKRYFMLLKKLAKRAEEIIVATDYDVEGEVIGWNVLRFIANRKTAKRMKYSTLTKNELEKSYEETLNELDWGQAYAGEARHILDWLYGINLSRALMSAIKTSGSFRLLSIGRVQGPALKIIVDREREIEKFKSVPFWEVIALSNNHNFKHPNDIFDKKELKKFENIKNAEATTKVSDEKTSPPYPFDLTTLQREAYRLHKIPPSQTLAAAQKLYLDSLISYPRTSSQKIPEAIQPKSILKALEKHFPEAKAATRQTPVEGKKSDPAHPSIYPTGEFKKLSGNEEKIYNLVVKRFISAFSSDAITRNTNVTLTALDEKGKVMTYEIKKSNYESENDEEKNSDDNETASEASSNQLRAEGAGAWREEQAIKSSRLSASNSSERTSGEKSRVQEITFKSSGLKILERGWTKVYPSTMKESQVPELKGKVKIDEIKFEEKETQPPKRFTPTSLITILEKKNLGTKATRSAIVETLFDRGYLDGQSIKATPLGMKLIESLEKYSPIIIDENLTRKLEEEMENIQESYIETHESPSSLEEKEKKIIENAKRIITDISKEFKTKETEIGKEIAEGLQIFRQEQFNSNILMKCPLCSKNDLRILYSKKTGRSFVACSGYPECKQTFSLPPQALIKKTDKVCEECGFPKLLSIKKGKRPWEFCFNPNCESNKKRREAWEAKKRENQESG